MLQAEVGSLRQERDQLKEKLGQQKFDPTSTDKKTRFHTVIPTVAAFMWLLTLLDPFIKDRSVISKKDQVILTLMKLRLGLQNQDLAYRFGVATSTVSNVINDCIPIMAQKLKFMIQWPNKEVTLRNLPTSFKRRFKNCKVIIDCTEFFIERPFNLKTRAQTWSNYKHHHTLKALIGITPYGAISFVSKMWGGRISDKDLTARSAFYQKLERGDQVMADRGFTISQELAVRGAHLVMPPFVAGRKQLPGVVVQRARQISSLRIHIERAIERIKNFVILNKTLSLSLVPLASDILTVCAALTNFSPKLIKSKK